MNRTKMNPKTLTLIASIAAALLAGGCSKSSSPESAPGSAPKPEAPPSAPKSKPLFITAKPGPGADEFSSFDAQNKHDRRTAWAVMNDDKDGYRGQAEWFKPASDGQLNFIEVAVGGKGFINVTLAEDNNGVPGRAIEVYPEISSSWFGRDGRLILVSANHSALKARTKYWVCIEPANKGTHCSWFYNNQELAQGFAFEREPGSWSFVEGGPRNGAFRVNYLK